MKVLIAKSKALLLGLMLSASLPWVFSYPEGQIRAASQSDENKAASLSDDEKAIHEQADRFAKAFSSGQANPIAELCTDDCTLTDAQGERFVGRDAILKLYQRCFRDYGANPAYVNIDSISFPAPDVCIEEGTLFVSKVNSENRYSVVHVKRNGQWLMLRITESPYNPQPAEALKDFDWMIGQWTIKDQGKTTYLRVHPIAHANFLVMRFSKDSGEMASPDELELLGWSFKSKDIVSWHFGADGGFGFGHWERMGSNWTISTKGVRRDGSETQAKYKIERVDNEHFRWQSTDRQSGGEKLPDLPAVEVTRDK
jgi:uncharacterized protein (TIGR02246 family)